MARDPNREIDTTSLHVLKDSQDMPAHRDYAAHFFRWGYVTRMIQQDKTRILDVGCGVDCALAYVIHWQRLTVPKSYLGVDYNKLKKPVNWKWSKFIEQFDFSKRWRELKKYGPFDLITCLEVVEHMKMNAVYATLNGMLELSNKNTRLMLSTPVFNGRPATNHINEMTIPQMRSALISTGWHVERRFGSFMSDHDRKKVATKEESALCERLKQYYSGDVMACFLAPLYPDASRNNVWVCRPETLEDIL